ncbi:hypothetical protein [Actimicrobium sp. CCI2.3]|uniref:hypothetical protein n=1 Tax=Actimicrobium sp. CCI2.3 TaxID=3048616 RepID=UPI002AB3F1C9|nr:hypothetical protein [Actimicrobium sp. CCI2.3]MDY7574551.1 hypothetical protein [Actimicrobium sp. CCI2.3]MEB0020927.1 hypothetical protein [Actimicrobium sp. CCI2.3]
MNTPHRTTLTILGAGRSALRTRVRAIQDIGNGHGSLRMESACQCFDYTVFICVTRTVGASKQLAPAT